MFEPYELLLIVTAFFLYLAEWKQDLLYYVFSAIGVILLLYNRDETSLIPYWVWLGLLFIILFQAFRLERSRKNKGGN